MKHILEGKYCAKVCRGSEVDEEDSWIWEFVPEYTCDTCDSDVKMHIKAFNRKFYPVPDEDANPNDDDVECTEYETCDEPQYRAYRIRYSHYRHDEHCEYWVYYRDPKLGRAPDPDDWSWYKSYRLEKP